MKHRYVFLILFTVLLASCSNDDEPAPLKEVASISQAEFNEKAVGKLWIGEGTDLYWVDADAEKHDFSEFLWAGDGLDHAYYFNSDGTYTRFYKTIMYAQMGYDNNLLSTNYPYVFDEKSGQLFEGKSVVPQSINRDFSSIYVASVSDEELVLYMDFGWQNHFAPDMNEDPANISYLYNVYRAATPEEEAAYRAKYIQTN